MTHKARTTEKGLFFQCTILYARTKPPCIFLGGNYLCVPRLAPVVLLILQFYKFQVRTLKMKWAYYICGCLHSRIKTLLLYCANYSSDCCTPSVAFSQMRHCSTNNLKCFLYNSVIFFFCVCVACLKSLKLITYSSNFWAVIRMLI